MKVLSQQARWNAAHPEVMAAATRRLEARNLRIVAQELQERGGHCVYPGCTDTKVEWHHRDPATKTKSIGSSVRLHSESRLRAELALCDPLCRKHHMIVDGRTERASNYWRVNQRIQTSRKPDSKLTEIEVRRIRRLKLEGQTNRSLAARFGVSPTIVSDIVTGKAWRWLSS